MQHTTLDLPTGYQLRSDSDVLTLCRLDDSVLARFSVRGVDLNEVCKAAEQDRYSGTIYDHEPPRPEAITDRPCLRVRFFGHFEVLCNDESLDLGRNGKALAIFKYLLAHRGRRASRDHLMGWLWPESGPKKARLSLNMAICALRKRLSGCSAGLRNCVLLEEDYYRVCPSVRVATDVEEFDLRYEEGRRLENTDRAEGIAEYEKALELYRDDYLLEDLYEDWTMLERERLSNTYLDVLERLAAYYKETERLQESVQTCLRILEKDRGHETSHLLLTECYALLGFYGRASRQYGLFQDVSKRAWGTEPSVETQERFEKVLLGRL